MRTGNKINFAGAALEPNEGNGAPSVPCPTLIQRKPFDYTEWQRTLWEDQSVEEISKAAMRICE